MGEYEDRVNFEYAAMQRAMESASKRGGDGYNDAEMAAAKKELSSKIPVSKTHASYLREIESGMPKTTQINGKRYYRRARNETIRADDFVSSRYDPYAAHQADKTVGKKVKDCSRDILVWKRIKTTPKT